MSHRSVAILLVVAAAWLGGCATPPRYQTTTRYEPPEGAAAQACLAGCQATLDACRTACQGRREQCLKTIEPEVEAAYSQALKRYAADLDLYRMDLDRYRMDLWLNWGHGHWWYEPWLPAYPPAAAPTPPNRDAVRDEVAKKKCDGDCGCQAPYDACYTNCGGRKIVETRCIANCPAK